MQWMCSAARQLGRAVGSMVAPAKPNRHARRRAGILVAVYGVLGFLAVGCAAHTTFTPVGAVPPLSRPSTCDYRLFTSSPKEFTELGTIDVESGASSDFATAAHVFKDQIRAEVCKAGGTAAIAMINGRGQYIKALVIRLPDGPLRPDAH